MLKAFLLYSMQFVSNHSEYDMQKMPVLVVTHEVDAVCDTVGAYACQFDNYIVMPKHCNIKLTLECKGALIHEMTHYMQEKSGKTFPCLQAWEKEAYAMENKYLKKYGKSLTDFGYTAVQIKVLTTCPSKKLF